MTTTITLPTQLSQLAYYESTFFDNSEIKKYIKELNKIKFNLDNDSMIEIYGKKFKIPRKQVAYGEPGLNYKFSGNKVPAKDWTNIPFLIEIKDKVENYLRNKKIITTEKINFVLINLYVDGSNYIGYHRDDEKDLKTGLPIVSVSFGAERDFLLRNRKKKETVKVTLKNGSLLVMSWKTNNEWYHSIPKRANVTKPRFNLTFRFLN